MSNERAQLVTVLVVVVVVIALIVGVVTIISSLIAHPEALIAIGILWLLAYVILPEAVREQNKRV
jgi:hypothetical protein